MAGPNDFTGNTVSSTYQRLLQISGSGEITDGTGSLVDITTGAVFNSFTSSYYVDSASFNQRLIDLNAKPPAETDPVFIAVSASFVSTASYQIDSASFVSNIFKERRYDSSASFSYCGTAPQNSPESSSVWSITRLFISSSGNTTITSASMVDWTNRYTHTYY